MRDFSDPITRASSLIFVIPEYDGTVPGILSYFMNHTNAPIDKKSVGLVGISAGRWGARQVLDAFKGTLTHRGARVLGDFQINIPGVDSKIQEGRVSDTDIQ